MIRFEGSKCNRKHILRSLLTRIAIGGGAIPIPQLRNKWICESDVVLRVSLLGFAVTGVEVPFDSLGNELNVVPLTT